MEADVSSLFGFVQDAQNVLTRIFGVLEFLLGISYVSGKYLTAGVLDLGLILCDFGKDLLVGLEFSLQFIAECAGLILRTFLLIYYAVGQIADAFYVTFYDLMSAIAYAAYTIYQLMQTSVVLVKRTLESLVEIPHQLCSALSIIGDFFLTFSHFLGATATTVLSTLISTPFYILNYFFILMHQVLSLPPKIFVTIPVSAYVGLLCVIISYVIFCRLSVRLLLLTSVNGTRRTLHLLRRLVTVLGKCFKKEPPQTLVVRVKDSNVSDDNPMAMCVVCLQKPVTYLATPCNHICICKECCYKLVKINNRCPMCRNYVDSYTRVYIS